MCGSLARVVLKWYDNYVALLSVIKNYDAALVSIDNAYGMTKEAKKTATFEVWVKNMRKIPYRLVSTLPSNTI